MAGRGETFSDGLPHIEEGHPKMTLLFWFWLYRPVWDSQVILSAVGGLVTGTTRDRSPNEQFVYKDKTSLVYK